MKNKIRLSSFIFVLLLAGVMVLAVNQLVQAQPGDLYEMTGSVGAGGTAVAGLYQTDVIVGQPAVAQQAAGFYELGSGFWGGGSVVWGFQELKIYLPMIQR